MNFIFFIVIVECLFIIEILNLHTIYSNLSFKINKLYYLSYFKTLNFINNNFKKMKKSNEDKLKLMKKSK